VQASGATKQASGGNQQQVSGGGNQQQVSGATKQVSGGK